jgi:hypothetical protein
MAILSLLSTTSARPAAQPQPWRAEINGTYVFQPEMYNIYPQQPDLARPVGADLHLETYGGQSQLEQVAVFRGLPTGAKSCTLGWSQSDKPSRAFIVKGDSGLSLVRPLSGFPADGPISYAAIQPFDDASEDEQFGPDFTLWDDEQYQEYAHIGGSVKCAGDIFVKISLRYPEQKTSLYLGQDEKNGLWIEYTL